MTSKQMKKKFGQNLNKLIMPEEKATPDPTPNKHGLLLLSAGKSKQNNSGSTSSSSWSPSAAVKKGSQSQHDALLSAVTGASRAATQKAPDAWGVKQEKEPEKKTSSTEKPEKPTSELEPSAAPSANSVPTPNAPTPNTASPDTTPGAGSSNAPSWDDYGGRGGGSSNNGANLGGATKTKEYMDQRAKERASKIQQEEAARISLQKERATARLKELEAKAAEPRRSDGQLWEPDQTQEVSPVHDKQLPKKESEDMRPVIHLNSYEDRDRGERPAARMLYDPKSGKMVELKEQKKRKSPRNIARKEAAKADKLKNKRGGGGRKTDALTENKPENKKNGARAKRGGRNNAAAPRARNKRGSGGKSKRGSKKEYNAPTSVMQNNGGGVSLFTGFNVQDHTGMQQVEAHQEEEEEEELPVFEVVKADDKIELITGVDDESPTLKPTAKIFAPSQAALAAAAAAAARGSDAEVVSDDDEDEIRNDSEMSDDDGPLGLGFDPTQDMDGLIQSPACPKVHSDLDLNALKLDPPLKSANVGGAGDGGPRHIFDFGSSGTWGGGKREVGHSDWEMPVGIGNAGGGIFGGSDTFGLTGSSSNEKSASDPTAFINIPASDSWGAATGGGFGGMSAMHGNDNNKTND